MPVTSATTRPPSVRRLRRTRRDDPGQAARAARGADRGGDPRVDDSAAAGRHLGEASEQSGRLPLPRLRTAIVHGALAYRDVRIEYPPGATGLFYLIWWIPGNYRAAFAGLMLVCLCVCLVGVVQTARALGYSPLRQAIAGGIVALSPLLLGSLVQARFDLVVAAVIAWMLYRRGHRALEADVGAPDSRHPDQADPAGAAAPAGDLACPSRPLARSLARGDRRGRDRRSASLSRSPSSTPSGTWYFIAYNLRRPPQIESIVSSAFLAAHTVVRHAHARCCPPTAASNIGGARPAPRDDRDDGPAGRLRRWHRDPVRAPAGARAPDARDAKSLSPVLRPRWSALTVTGKVLSPQYMVWLVPVIPLLPGRLWRAATITLVAALVLTQAFFPLNYLHLVESARPGDRAAGCAQCCPDHLARPVLAACVDSERCRLPARPSAVAAPGCTHRPGLRRPFRHVTSSTNSANSASGRPVSASCSVMVMMAGINRTIFGGMWMGTQEDAGIDAIVEVLGDDAPRLLGSQLHDDPGKPPQRAGPRLRRPRPGRLGSLHPRCCDRSRPCSARGVSPIPATCRSCPSTRASSTPAAHRSPRTPTTSIR